MNQKIKAGKVIKHRSGATTKELVQLSRVDNKSFEVSEYNDRDENYQNTKVAFFNITDLKDIAVTKRDFDGFETMTIRAKNNKGQHIEIKLFT